MPIPKVSTSLIRKLKKGKSCIVGPCRATSVSAEFARSKPAEFTQELVLVVSPKSAECQRMFLVTRTN